MYDLKCKRQNCEYNKNCNCTKSNIEISNTTLCDSYKQSNEAEVGEIEKIDQPAIRKDIKVDCEANCIFNKDAVCGANGITVQTCENKHCPKCCTFMPK